MKFTKLIVSSATILSALAMTAPVVASAATPNNDATVNGGQALPQNGSTTAGISFGQLPSTGNTGYLRLQQVPNVLDFGNHTQFLSAYPNFTADGQNQPVNNAATDQNTPHPNYKGGNANQTAILNTQDANLDAVKGKAWATVVDKQDSRSAEENAASTGATSEPGDWTLSVKADGPLTLKDDAGNATGTTTDATLSFANTASAQTGATANAVYNLTNESQDKDYTAASSTPVSAVAKTIAVNVSASDTQHTVATAATGEGAGADVFAWDRNNIRLTLPQTFAAQNGIYETTLTWTLSSTLN
jgi:hypothetical protein